MRFMKNHLLAVWACLIAVGALKAAEAPDNEVTERRILSKTRSRKRHSVRRR